MGATFYFDKMLPGVEHEANGARNPRRQVEVFDHGQKLYLRVGALNEENSGINPYTVQLSGKDATELIEALQDEVSRLGL